MNSFLFIIMTAISTTEPGNTQKNDSVFTTFSETLPAELIALEKTALEEWNNGNPDGFINLSADDVTYIDPSLEHKLEGLEQLRHYYEKIRGKVAVDRYEMIRPVVQSVANMAVLTYHLRSYRGAKLSKWNCTEVYRLEADGQWKIIHTHWTLADRAPETD